MGEDSNNYTLQLNLLYAGNYAHALYDFTHVMITIIAIIYNIIIMHSTKSTLIIVNVLLIVHAYMYYIIHT